MEGTVIRTIIAFFLCVLGAIAFAQDTSIVKEIKIEGLVNVQPQAILAVMTTKKDKAFVQAQLAKDKQAIDDLGYFKSVDVLARPSTGTDWEVVVRVSEYPIVKEIRVTGNTVVKSEEILKAVTQETGQILNKRNLNTTREAVIKLYTRKDYVADIEKFEPLEGSPNTLDLVVIEKTINSITFKGLVKTKPGTVRRLFKSKPGRPFNLREFQQDMSALVDSQWFEKINDPIETQVPDDIGKFDYLIDVKEGTTRNIGLGLQLDPRNRLAGLIRLSDSNFRGTGQSISLGYTQPTSGGGPSVDLTYGLPWIDSRNTALSISAYSRLQSNFSGSGFGGTDSPYGSQNFDERRTGGSFTFTRPFGDRYSASAGARVERVETLNADQAVSNNFIQQDGTISVLNFGIVRDRRNSRTEPTAGDYFRILTEPGVSNIDKIGGGVANNPELLGRNSFLKTQIEYRRYFSKKSAKDREALPNLMKPVLAFRASYGIIGGRPPFFEQFFAGGSDTVRGYSEQRFWGKQQFISTLEYRIPIQKSFYAATFVDYGGAWGGYGTAKDFTQTNSFRLHLGYGVGIGFRTPLGPIRIDFGINEKGGNRTHLLIGTGF